MYILCQFPSNFISASLSNNFHLYSLSTIFLLSHFRPYSLSNIFTHTLFLPLFSDKQFQFNMISSSIFSQTNVLLISFPTFSFLCQTMFFLISFPTFSIFSQFPSKLTLNCLYSPSNHSPQISFSTFSISVKQFPSNPISIFSYSLSNNFLLISFPTLSMFCQTISLILGLSLFYVKQFPTNLILGLSLFSVIQFPTNLISDFLYFLLNNFSHFSVLSTALAIKV